MRVTQESDTRIAVRDLVRIAIAHEGSQSAVARSLGVHSNTILAWLHMRAMPSAHNYVALKTKFGDK